jgi:hypothetical protein
MHGFARRVDDTVACAMLILENRENYTRRDQQLQSLLGCSHAL